LPVEQLKLVVFSSLLAGLMAVGAYIHVPIGPVPIVLTNLFVLLSGLLLGSRWGMISTVLYLLVGFIGLPVFSGGKGGPAHFLGPTGGYLLGYAVSAWITGFFSERFGHATLGDVVAVLLGSLIIYGFGVPWLKAITKMSWNKAWIIGVFPFLPGDVLKAASAVILARAVRPMLKQQILPLSG
jgi:biotin transport system substrate-specific component